MVKHIVCFKLKNKDDVKKSVEILRSMEGKVPSALKIEVGEDFLHSGRSFDIILQVTLENKEMLDVYQNDKYHVEVVKTHMHSVCEKSISVDYEF